MKKMLWNLFFSTLVYLFTLSLSNNFYLAQVNKQLENTINELVRQISEIQSLDGWNNLQKEQKQ